MPIESRLITAAAHYPTKIFANAPVPGLNTRPTSSAGIRPAMSKLVRHSELLRVLVATPYGEDGAGGIDRLNDLIFETVRSQPGTKVVVERLVTRGKKGLLAAQFIFAYAIIRLCIKAMFRRVDILHIHLSIRGSSYRKTVLAWVARIFRIPYVVHLHGCNFDEFWSETNDFLARRLEILFKQSAHCVVLGSYWSRAIAERVPEIADRISVLPNATSRCPFEQEPATDGRVRITFLGQLGRRKGTPQLIEALGQLASRSDWMATIAGDGDLTESRIQVQKHNIDDRTFIPGWLGLDETKKLLRQTDILVLPSYSENLPMVILEAFAHGVAVISTPVGAVPEVIEHEHSGLLVPVGDVTALTMALERLIKDPTLRDRLGSSARRVHAERYEIEPYVTRLLKIWQKLMPASTNQHRPHV